MGFRLKSLFRQWPVIDNAIERLAKGKLLSHRSV
jgi:hypothetical protein